MQILKITIALTLLPFMCNAEQLSEEARQALIKRISEIGKESESIVNQKFTTAMKSFASAAASENAAFELYLKCEEKLNFEDKMKKAVDFRDWKAKNDEKFSDANFRRALQFQLQWFCLTLKANAENADREKLSLEVASYIDSMVSQAEGLALHQSILNQGVTSSIFAQAYNINGVEVKNWPLSPGKIEAVYDQVILPPLRRADRIDALKAAWLKRINQEGQLVESWSSDKTKSTGINAQSLAYQNFVTETLPSLRWAAEMDIYKAGDEVGSSARMIKLIEDNLSHKSATTWVQQLSQLVGVAKEKETKLKVEILKPAE